MQKHALAWIISIFLFPLATDQTASATAIAIIRTTQELAIAADSLAVDGTGSRMENNECKIREVGGVLFAVNGLAAEKNSGLDVLALAMETFRGGGSLSERITKFENLVMTPLQSAVNRILQNDSSGRKFILEHAVLGVNFAAIENNIPALYGRRFTISSDDPIIKIERHQCPGSDCPNGEITVLTGPEKYKKQFYKENPVLSGDLAEMARKFVQAQIDENVPDVGPPIDLVLLTANGVKWMQRKRGC
jgi:hypothetical protein